MPATNHKESNPISVDHLLVSICCNMTKVKTKYDGVDSCVAKKKTCCRYVAGYNLRKMPIIIISRRT